MMFFVTTTAEEETVTCGETLGSVLKPNDVILLCGDLGAGKTHLTKGVAKALGVTETVTSPTFTVLIAYEGTNMPLFHFDLYRLENASMLEDVGYWESLEGGGVSVVEWGDKFPDEFPDDFVRIEMQVTGDAERRLNVFSNGARSEELVRDWHRVLETSA